MKKHLGRWGAGLGLALAGLGVAWLGLHQTEAGLTRRPFKLEGEHEGEGQLSGLAFEPEQATLQTPAMIVAHGFSGSKELMQFIGAEIARRGVRAYLFDFPGHGSAPVPFVPPTSLDFSGVVKSNVRQIERVYNRLRQNFPGAEIGVLGHSMGSAAVSTFATAHPELKATIPVSPVGTPTFSPKNPKNLLVLVGERDIPFSKESSHQFIRQATGQAKATSGQTVGNFENGSARRLAILKGLDHISILYAPSTIREITGWLSQSFGTSSPYQSQTTRRLAWTGTGIISAFAAFFPFSRIITNLLSSNPGKAMPEVVRSSWRFSDHAGAFGLVLGSQFASALVWNKVKLPKLIRLQLGDYMAAFFSLSGLVTWAGLAIFGRGRLKAAYVSRAAQGDVSAKFKSWGLLPVGLWAFVYATVGFFSQRSWTNLTLTPVRARAMGMITLGMLPYFLADEFVCRRVGGWRGYGLSLFGKLGAMAALVLAVRLKPELGFLMILLPIMVLTFALFGLCSMWQFRQGQDFVTTAVFQALIFAWMISILFPVI